MADRKRIVISAGDVRVEAELNDSPCAAAIYDALPIDATANTWGEEIYFKVDLSFDLADDASEDVDVGQLGYWPPGKAFCVFFGRTPVSDSSGRPRAASRINLVGNVLGNATVLKSVVDGDTVLVEPGR